MGLRKTVLTTLKDLLDDLVISVGSGRILRAENTLFDPLEHLKDLPKLSIVPGLQTIKVGLFGRMMDSVYRISIFGYYMKAEGENLFTAGEDIVEQIIQKLTAQASVTTMFAANFSIVEMGPILNEQFDEDGNLGYITIGLTIEFVEN
jgi:hypothetical protein